MCIRDRDIKKDMLAGLIASTLTQNKPTGDELFQVAKDQGTVITKCNLLIPLVRMSAVVKEGNSDRSDKSIPAEYLLEKKEGAEWSKKYLTWWMGVTKASQHMKVASDPSTYAVPDYQKFVPATVISARDTFANKFHGKHHGTNSKLTRQMINTSYIIFKCNLNLLDQDHVDEHYLDVHSLEGGAAALIQLEEIEVNTKLPFSVPDLQAIEKLGPDKRTQVFTSFYNQSVAR